MTSTLKVDKIEGVTASGTVAIPNHVIQTVTSSFSTQTSSSSSTFADTGLTASITPSSSTSKILVIVQVASCFTQTNTNTEMDVNLLRDSTTLIATFGPRGGNSTTNGDAIGTAGAVFLDSPSSTSSLTYKCQFKSTQNNAQVNVQLGGTTSTMMLQEIAQ
tara:strand:+ start:1721 stop:2203 length:483 start_codon:yes stop_codon:yes gene_type:complete